MRLEQCAERTRSLRPRVPLRRDAARADYSIYSSSSCTAHDTSGFVFAGGCQSSCTASRTFCWLSNVSHELSRRAVRIVYDRYWAVWTSVSTWTPLAHSLIDRTGALPVSAHWDASGVLMFVELSQKRTR